MMHEGCCKSKSELGRSQTRRLTLPPCLGGQFGVQKSSLLLHQMQKQKKKEGRNVCVCMCENIEELGYGGAATAY